MSSDIYELSYTVEELVTLHQLYPNDKISITVSKTLNTEIESIHNSVPIKAPNIPLLMNELNRTFNEEP